MAEGEGGGEGAGEQEGGGPEAGAQGLVARDQMTLNLSLSCNPNLYVCILIFTSEEA